MTKYYFTKTNAFNEVVATDGERAYSLAVNSNGCDITTGVDVYTGSEDEIVEKLRAAFAEVDGLYSMDEIVSEFGENDIYPFDADSFEYIVEVAEIQ